MLKPASAANVTSPPPLQQQQIPELRQTSPVLDGKQPGFGLTTLVQDLSQGITSTIDFFTGQVSQISQDLTQVIINNAQVLNSNWNGLFNSLGGQGYLDPVQSRKNAPGQQSSQAAIGAQSVLGTEGQLQSKTLAKAAQTSTQNAINSLTGIQPLIVNSAQQVNDSATAK